MGFLITGDLTSPGTGYIDVGQSYVPQLWFTVTNPPYNKMFSDGTAGFQFNPPTPTPPHRKSAAMANIEPGVAVLFGGVDANGALNDTWLHDWGASFGGGWLEVEPETVPPARWGHSMCQGGSGVLMFGGFDEQPASQ